MNFTFVDRLKLTTPICTFRYPKLVEPDTKFNPEGAYMIQGVMDAAAAATLSDQLDDLLNRHKASLKQQAPTQSFKLADMSFGFEDVDGRPSFTIKTKMKAAGIDRDGRRWTSAPALFDAKGYPIKDRESLRNMWTGTKGRISFEACPFYVSAIGAGITMRLKAVQIIDLVESGGSADSFGFGEEEGYTAGETPVPFDATGSIPDGADF